LPKDTDEYSNANLTDVYNLFACHAGLLGCSFVLVHHVSKGNQAGKSVTDVGAGAGSQSRATDTHLVLRQHELDDVCVLDAAVRSWPPIEPICLRWTFPVFRTNRQTQEEHYESDHQLVLSDNQRGHERAKRTERQAAAMHREVTKMKRKLADLEKQRTQVEQRMRKSDI
jgi:RecA-family ATPase